MATFGVIVFPGSNCDHDAYHAMKHVLGCETKFLWHKDTDLSGIDFLIVPGVFPMAITCVPELLLASHQSCKKL